MSKNWVVTKINKKFFLRVGTKVFKCQIGKSGYKIYTKKQEFDRYSLVEIELLTGRHHQIRSQLSAEGLTIKGDLKYGAKRPNNGGSIHLHARKLTLTHPTLKEPVTFTAPPPKDALWNSIPAIETQ